jgi:hypothetical protein
MRRAMPTIAANAHPIPIPILAPWERVDPEVAFDVSTIGRFEVSVGPELWPEDVLEALAPDVCEDGADVAVV